MNKIEKTIRDLIRIHNHLGVDCSEDVYNVMKEELIDEAYRKGKLNFLVNVGHLDECFSDLSDSNNYEVLTWAAYYDGETFTSKEQYESYVSEQVKNEVSTFKIEKDANSDNYIILKQNYILKEYNTFEDDFDTEDDALERLEEIKNELFDEFPKFNELEFRYDEVGITYGRSYLSMVNIDVANKVGLGVAKYNNSKNQCLFVIGGGSEYLYQFLQYQALAYGKLDEKNVDDSIFKSVKRNLCEEEYREFLISLGVNISRYEKYNKL